MDPMSALAMIKAGLSAGKQIHSLGKEIAGFFDSVDDTNKKHQKKKNSIFTSSNEEALDTFMQKERAKDAELQLKELITQTRGYSAYQELLNLRREIRLERKELERQARIEREELQNKVITIAIVTCGLVLTAVTGGAYLWYIGMIKF